MKPTRRTFLGLAGIGALGLAGRSAVGAFSKVIAPGGALGEGGGREKRLALVVDPRKCMQDEGCTACMTACGMTHNIPHIPDIRHEIKWIWKEPFEKVFHGQSHEFIEEDLKDKPVMVLCNHCEKPPCVRVCPTQATWKRKEDGIVMMDWHRCIGCRYCVAACPYGSRSFNWQDPKPHIGSENPDFPTRSMGVVEKCTFCEERLRRGQGLACAEACKEQALVFGDLNDPDSEVRRLLKTRYSLQRRPELGTGPEIYYLV
jgi:molybdopterin-containing oxidoreductase family iron-sulfur binding subunit